MKRLIYTFALLFVTFGAMAWNIANESYIYFSNTNNWNVKTIQFLIGNDSWSQGYAMTSIGNTKLYFVKMPAWDNYGQWAVIGTDAAWGGEGNSVKNRAPWAIEKTNVVTTNAGLGKYSIIYADAKFTTNNNTDGYSSLLNKTHTIKSYVGDVESSEGGTITATSYKLSSATATQSTSGTTSIVAAYTATIKLTATVNDGYEFIGWYIDGTQKSTSTTYSYTAPNSAETISAKYRKLAVAEPQIVSFSASPSEIDLGQSVTFNVEVENADKKDVVFKNGNTVITPPWKPAEGGVYTITANLNGATSQSVKVTVYAATIYFDNTISGWSNVYAYCWNSDSDKNENWPGVKLTNQVGNIYTYKSTKIYKNVIFTNNSEKTADLVFENGETYSMPEPIPFVAGTEELCGSAWNGSDEANKMEKVDGVFKKTYTNVPAGTHKFKIVYKGSWLGFDHLEKNEDCSSIDDKNIQFTLDKSRDVIISFDPTTSKITLKIVYDNFPVGKKFYFSPKTEGARYAAYLFGTSGEKWIDMTKEYKAIYSFTMPEGEWDGLIYCEMKSGTIENNWSNKKMQTANLRYNGENNWFVESDTWRKFENLIDAGQKLYFKPDKNWESKGARFAAYYWDILGENRWANCVYDSVDHAYHVVAPTVGEGVNRVVWTNIKFVCMNSKPQNDWANKLYETPDLVYNGTEDFFIIKLNDAKDLNSADEDNWISFSHPFKGAIFFEPNASLKAAANKRFSIYLWNGFDEYCWVKMQPLATHPDIYCVVIPEGYWTGANICSMNPATNGDSFEEKNDKYIDLLNQTDNLTYHSDKLLYKAPDKWDFMVPADECWKTISPLADRIVGNSETEGFFYQRFIYQKTISGEDVNKWHWISLPYNVKISDIQGGVYETDFIIQEYNTAERAEWKDNIAANNKSAWRQMEASETLLAGKGYILAVNNEKSSYSLTFVSETDLNVVADQFEGYNTNFSSDVPESANWHLIGTGVYGNAGGYENVNYVAKPDATGADYTYHFLGKEPVSNFNPTSLGVDALEPYTAFFVQHTGEYSFSKVQPAQNAAPRRARAEEVVEQYYVNIVGMADTSHTAIFLAEDGSDDYVVGKDFLHLGASGASLQLYTLQGESTLSFNYLKREDRTVLVGGYVAQSGKYTISLEGNGEASSVLIYDMETGLVADLLNENYEFEAEKGILDGRFSVIISYAAGDGPATEVENDMTMGVVVVNCDGIARFEGLSIGENVAVYDVVGRCVSLFVAESDKADVMLTSGVYVLYHNGETVKFVVNR